MFVRFKTTDGRTISVVAYRVLALEEVQKDTSDAETQTAITLEGQGYASFCVLGSVRKTEGALMKALTATPVASEEAASAE